MGNPRPLRPLEKRSILTGVAHGSELGWGSGVLNCCADVRDCAPPAARLANHRASAKVANSSQLSNSFRSRLKNDSAEPAPTQDVNTLKKLPRYETTRCERDFDAVMRRASCDSRPVVLFVIENKPVGSLHWIRRLTSVRIGCSVGKPSPQSGFPILDAGKKKFNWCPLAPTRRPRVLTRHKIRRAKAIGRHLFAALLADIRNLTHF
jgi:hypothetical protein